MHKVLALLLVIAPVAGGQTTQIGTFTPPTLPAATANTGPFSTNSVGQGFFAPTTATSLVSLTYYLSLAQGYPGGGQSSISVFAFNGTIPTGAALFTQAFTNPTSTGIFAQMINPNIAVAGGARYIALVSTSVNNSIYEANVDEIKDSPANTTGDVFYLCFAGTTTCSVRDPGNVAAFQATFATPTGVTATPEPSTIVLAATGILGLAVVRRKRRAS